MNRRRFISTAVASGMALAARAAGTAPGLRVAVIGHTGQGNYGHGLDTMWLRVPGTRIVAVSDPDPQGLAAAGRRLGVTEKFSDFRKMLDTVRPDIVSIAPRHIALHRDMALASVEAGARGIYMEKPFCRTLAEADEILTACKARNVKLALAHRVRYHPVLPVISDLLATNVLGTPLEIRARGKEDTRGGALDLWILGSHLLTLIHYFGGRPLACSATLLEKGRPVEREDLHEGAEGVGPIGGNELHARFEMESGLSAYFDSVANAGDRDAGFGLQLIGSEGIILVRPDQEPAAHLLRGNPFKPVEEARTWVPITSAGPGRPEPIDALGSKLAGHLLPGEDLVAAIRENRPPLCSAEDGRVTIEMIMAVFESHRLRGRRVSFPLKVPGNPLAVLS